MILKGGKVLNEGFVFEKCNVGITGNRISCVGKNGIGDIDCTDCYVVPGLIDVHTHGCLGYDYTSATGEEIAKMRESLLSCGVTSFLPTLLTSSKETYLGAAERIAFAASSDRGARILGIHMEGPYYSHSRKGAQNGDYIRMPSVSEFDEINAASGNMVKLISLAPENEGAPEFIDAVKGRVRVAVGHTAASYEQAKTAFLAGASQLTHTFNGMPPLHHREPSVIGAAFENDNVLCECICDGFHLHPSAVRLLFSAVGPDRAVLISDSIAPAGLPDGEYTLGLLPISVREGRAYLADGKTIAGSTVTVYDCVKRAIEFGIAPEAAFKAATFNAARSAGAESLVGSIAEGKYADVLVLDGGYNIKHIIKGGELVK